jgi:hypothetical protein
MALSVETDAFILTKVSQELSSNLRELKECSLCEGCYLRAYLRFGWGEILHDLVGGFQVLLNMGPLIETLLREFCLLQGV